MESAKPTTVHLEAAAVLLSRSPKKEARRAKPRKRQTERVRQKRKMGAALAAEEVEVAGEAEVG